MHFLFRLITLPIRILVRLVMIPFHVIGHFGHHGGILLLLIFGAILYFALHGHHQNSGGPVNNTLPAAPPVQVAPELRGAQPQRAQPRIDPVMKVENGDSQFAHDLYAAMTPPEQAAYSQMFYGVMGSVADGQQYPWAQGNIQGTLMPVQSFNNKMGNRCRTFSEVLKVHTVEQRLTGIACQDENGTWCKLKPTATPVCGLGGYHPSPFQGIGDSLKHLF